MRQFLNFINKKVKKKISIPSFIDLIVKNNTGLSLGANGLLQSDENGVTTRRGVFASGDVVTGARTVVEAVAFSKRVAVSIEEFISKLPPKTVAS